VPASVVTRPAGVILRIVLFPKSATKTFPAPSAATFIGMKNLAVLPVPSVLPKLPAEPAKVLTTPVGVILRIVWAKGSATKTLPEPSTPTPAGLKNRAALPVPSTLPIPDWPTKVVVAYVWASARRLKAKENKINPIVETGFMTEKW